MQLEAQVHQGNQKLEEVRGNGPVNTFTSNFWPPKLWENTFLLF
jgi:hypothetical protein